MLDNFEGRSISDRDRASTASHSYNQYPSQIISKQNINRHHEQPLTSAKSIKK